MNGNKLKEFRHVDGREILRDAQGLFRDAKSGKFVSKSEIVEYQSDSPENAESHSRQAIVTAVSQHGLAAKTPEEAWGKIVGVQAEIALEAGGGTKATQAAKLVAQATGMLENEEEDPLPWMEIVLGKTLALQVVGLANQEKDRRGKADEIIVLGKEALQ